MYAGAHGGSGWTVTVPGTRGGPSHGGGCTRRSIPVAAEPAHGCYNRAAPAVAAATRDTDGGLRNRLASRLLFYCVF